MKHRKIVLTLLFFSGFASLVYQVLFTRLFNIVFGLFIHSTVMVVATYMIGLSLGYFLSRNIKTSNNLSFYGYLELIIGIYSVIVLASFGIIDKLYTTIGNYLIVKFILSMIILLTPTTAMGITIPIIVEYLRRTENQEMIDKVYGINSLGASVGAILSSVVFINLLGLTLTFILALTINILIFLISIIISKESKIKFQLTQSNLPIRNIGIGFSIIVLIFGFNGMALEILWYRLLVYFISNNTFSFSIVISVIILGISLGALLYKPLLKLLKLDFYLIVFISFFTGIYTILSIHILNNSYTLMGGIFNIFGNIIFGILGDNKISETITLFITRYILVTLTAGIISISSGVIIPSIFNTIRGFSNENIDSQSISGTILAFNTIGSILGIFTITYLMIPLLGFSNSFIIISLLYIFSGFVIMISLGCNRILGSIGFVIALLVILIPKEITFTKYYNGFWNIKGELKFYKEGLYGTVAVFDVKNTRYMKINGIDEVPNDYNSIIAFKMLGNAPFILKTNYSKVMLNALGGGITLSSVLNHTKHKTVVVDICPDVIDTLKFFSNYNSNVFTKTNWIFIEDDGRNFLKSYKGKFDIIIADATHPASSESWMLFSKEFYKTVYEKLENDGIFAQWIPLHNLEIYDYVSIIKTLDYVFSNVTILITGIYTLAISKKGNIDRFEIISKEFSDLESIGINEENFKSLVFLSPELSKILINKEKGEILSDLRSSVEFAEFHRRVAENTTYKNIKLILKYSTPIELSKFTGLSPTKHYSMILSKTALIEYWENHHYNALKILDKSLELNPKNFYSKFLFSQIFPEFINLLYKYQDNIKSEYGTKTYQELLDYAQKKLKEIETKEFSH